MSGGVESAVFAGLMGAMLLLGIGAARWRRPRDIHSLEEWGVGGRAFGNWTTWFLLGGSMYSAYTFVAVPALTYGVGAMGFFAIPFATITTPLSFIFTTRAWSVAHRHGFVTPGEFTAARFGSRGLGAAVALTGIAATMPYIAVQLSALQAVLQTVGLAGEWPLLAAVTVVALCTFRSGLRAPALLSIAKDVLLGWVVVAALLIVAMNGGWGESFKRAGAHFAATPNPSDGLLLGGSAGQSAYLTLVIGSALSIFVYPHALTTMLAAKDRSTVQRNAAALPIYCLVLGLMAMLGFFALSQGVLPVGRDLNTVMPQLFHGLFPPWSSGIALAAFGIAALIPAAVMSIAAANAFTRSIYRAYLRPAATPAEEARVSRWTSLVVKIGAVGCILLLDPAFSVDLQLIGGVIILQTIPAGFIGLLTNWFHRLALIAGLVAGLAAGVVMLYRIPQAGPGGTIAKAHFGGSITTIGGWPVYVGIVALLVNLAVAVAGTLLLRAARVRRGRDQTRPDDYDADADDPMVKRLENLLDGLPTSPAGVHAVHRHPR
ncbi:sodium:solute symporter family protein [Dactylosporangium sp. NPDC000244]|uniref:sodium:solute symporter family protein n=1 Tax=Dactylosporangium sp. NPDC000244 TaxID=3154365 RepID=UPI0033236351